MSFILKPLVKGFKSILGLDDKDSATFDDEEPKRKSEESAEAAKKRKRLAVGRSALLTSGSEREEQTGLGARTLGTK